MWHYTFVIHWQFIHISHARGHDWSSSVSAYLFHVHFIYTALQLCGLPPNSAPVLMCLNGAIFQTTASHPKCYTHGKDAHIYEHVSMCLTFAVVRYCLKKNGTVQTQQTGHTVRVIPRNWRAVHVYVDWMNRPCGQCFRLHLKVDIF